MALPILSSNSASLYAKERIALDGSLIWMRSNRRNAPRRPWTPIANVRSLMLPMSELFPTPASPFSHSTPSSPATIQVVMDRIVSSLVPTTHEERGGKWNEGLSFSNVVWISKSKMRMVFRYVKYDIRTDEIYGFVNANRNDSNIPNQLSVETSLKILERLLKFIGFCLNIPSHKSTYRSRRPWASQSKTRNRTQRSLKYPSVV